MKKVYVVTNSQLGWDNVVAVFDAALFTKTDIEATFNAPYEYVAEHTVQTDLEGWATD